MISKTPLRFTMGMQAGSNDEFMPRCNSRWLQTSALPLYRDIALAMSPWFENFVLMHLPVSLLRKTFANFAAGAGAPCGADKQLLIDVSVISNADAGTGIQRVVRNLYQELLSAPPPGYRVRPVAATRTQGYCYLPTDFLQHSSNQQPGIPVDVAQVHAADLFLGLDLAAHIIPYHLGQLVRWKRQGLRIYFLVYDLLPVIEPAWFNPKMTQNFRRWLRAVALLADAVVAISSTVKMDFAAWMRLRYGLDDRSLPCTVIQLGTGLGVRGGSQSITRPASSLPPNLLCSKFVLMVGTIEPRKGHAEALDAFEQLWQTGDQTQLVIAGKEGWKVESLVHHLRTHPEVGNRLHWLDGPSDETLMALYQQCDGLIMASMGEGLGLPLNEAAYFKKPVLVRDIPIFREIEGDGVDYFAAAGSNDLKRALPRWLQNLETLDGGEKIRRDPITWRQSCSQLIGVLQART
jgi:glycosyltransferase involved in cell wall biosynthesis